MAGPIIHAISLPQWGLETNGAPAAPTAAVAATGKMAVKDFIIKPTDTVIRDAILKGLAIANRGNELIGERGTDWEIPETPVIYNQIHYFFGMAIVGPTLSVATWTATHTPAAVQARHMRTIELRMTDGTNNSDVELPASHLKEIEFIGAANSPVRFRASGSSRRIQSSTLTAALALPTIVEGPTALTKVFIDTSWAGLGGTQVSGQVMGWRWKLATGIQGQSTMDGRSDQDLTVVLLNPDELKWTCEIDIKANLNTGQWQTEKTAAEAGTLRAIEIRSDMTASYQMKLQGLFKYSAGSLFPEGRENGEVTAKLVLEGTTDDTNTIQMSVLNTTVAAIT